MPQPDPQTPTRAQLFKLLGSHDLVKLFEKLFERAGNTTPTETEEISIAAGLADSKANQAIDMAIRLMEAAEPAILEVGTASSKANQAIGTSIENEIKSKSNGVLLWLSM